MLNRKKHQLIMGRILRDISNDTSIAPLLGLKGGTCAYFFYGLPRFSVDLDFDFISNDKAAQPLVYNRLKSILKKYGDIKDSYIKRFTIFFLLSYGPEDHNVKIEVNIRMDIPKIADCYEVKELLGISMLAAGQPYLFGGKLAALTLRSQTAMRDIYDIWYYASNNWDIDSQVIKIRTGKTLKKQLASCIALIEQVEDNQILQGLGELLNEKEKVRVKSQVRSEVIFMLKNYISILK